MSTPVATQEERKKTQERNHLSLLLRRQLALEKDVLMSDANALVNEHFTSTNKSNALKPAQLKNLEGVAFTSLRPGEVVNFIVKQAGKEKGDKKWTHNELNKKLLERISQITGRPPRKNTGEAGLKDEVIEAVKSKAQDPPAVSEDVLGGWFSEHLELEIQMELLRAFISHFATFYVLKALMIPGHTREEEE